MAETTQTPEQVDAALAAQQVAAVPAGTPDNPLSVTIVGTGGLLGAAPAGIAKGLDETVPGGRYVLASGQVVDAEGQPFSGKRR